MEFNSIAAYRYPGEDSINILKGKLKSGIHKGFVIAPFRNIEKEIATICSCQPTDWEEVELFFSQACATIGLDSFSSFNITGESTTKTQHCNEVENIISELKGNEFEKTIACRRICGKDNIDIKQSFLNLAEKLPSAFIFLFITPLSGCWIGASPEMLLKSNGNIVETYALAGTRPMSKSDSKVHTIDYDSSKNDFMDNPWDDKNIKEHRIVAEYIGEIFKKWQLDPTFSDLSTRKAGNVEHIFQAIKAEFKPDFDIDFNLTKFLAEFSPTPALCGMPKDKSLTRICKLENFDREYYGGFCGVFEDIKDFSFYVILRSLKFNSTKWCFFAGGGITAHSSPGKEWEETELKLSGILSKLSFKD